MRSNGPSIHYLTSICSTLGRGWKLQYSFDDDKTWALHVSVKYENYFETSQDCRRLKLRFELTILTDPTTDAIIQCGSNNEVYMRSFSWSSNYMRPFDGSSNYIRLWTDPTITYKFQRIQQWHTNVNGSNNDIRLSEDPTTICDHASNSQMPDRAKTFLRSSIIQKFQNQIILNAAFGVFSSWLNKQSRASKEVRSRWTEDSTVCLFHDETISLSVDIFQFSDSQFHIWFSCSSLVVAIAGWERGSQSPLSLLSDVIRVPCRGMYTCVRANSAIRGRGPLVELRRCPYHLYVPMADTTEWGAAAAVLRNGCHGQNMIQS